MPGMTTRRLPYTDYYIRRARNFEWENSTSKQHYFKPRIEEWESAYNSCRQYEIKPSRIWIGHTRLTYAHLMSKNEHPSICRNAACGDQRLKMKHCPQDCPQWGKKTGGFAVVFILTK